MKVDILVIGSGPAGVATALGLSRLGYQTVVVGNNRPHPVFEGISERVVASLNYCGFHEAVKTVSEPVARSANWNGEQRSVNVERLVPRQEFDLALLQDLKAHGVQHIPGRVNDTSFDDGMWSAKVQLANGQQQSITAGYLVEARGRAAPLARVERVRGPESLTVYQNWQTEVVPPATLAGTVENGWIWLANNGRGRLYSQFTSSSAEKPQIKKSDIPDLILQQLSTMGGCKPFAGELKAGGDPGARSSTPILTGHAVDSHCIRVGDAAMAADPLSGNGIFMALSSALIAPAVINTLLKRPEHGALATEFYQARLQHLFMRFARTGRDFYRQEQRWQTSAFWQSRSQWPDSEPSHATENRVIGIAEKPVVNNGWIEPKPVVITTDNPLGIWKMDGKDFADILRAS